MSGRPEPRILLLRGVNVSGANRLPMTDFRAMLADLGFDRPETYIQSGNALIGTSRPDAEVAEAVQHALHARFGFPPAVFVLSPDALHAALTDHPFADAAPEKVHVFFLSQPPAALDEATLRTLAAPGDGWALSPGRLTLHTPAGIGRSRLADRLARLLPAPVTARNLNTLAALAGLLSSPIRDDGAG